MSKANGLLATFTKFMLEHDIECEEDLYQNEDIDRDAFECHARGGTVTNLTIPYAIKEDVEREAYNRWNRRENDG